MYMKQNIVHHTIATSTALTSTNSREVDNEVREILRQNGYGSRECRCWKPQRSPGGTPLIIPFITDSFALDVNRIVKRSGLPISLIFRPPPSLRRLLTASRLYENQCERTDCLICEGEHKVCNISGVVYKVVCTSCEEFYIGETGRPLGKRMDEHLRALRSPQSYPDNPFSKHRTLKHARDPLPQLRVSILHRNLTDPVERKIKEALEIKHWEPPINRRDEMKNAMRLITL